MAENVEGNLNISPLSIELENPLKNFEESLSISIDKVKGDSLVRVSNAVVSLPDFWKQLGSYVEILSRESDKLSIMFSKPPLPSKQETQSLVNGIELVTIALLSTFSSLGPAQHGLTFHKIVKNFILDLLKAFLQFLCAINNNNKKESVRLIGVVWEHCKSYTTLPKDLKEAVLQQGKSSHDLISDAVTEAEEFCHECEEEDLHSMTSEMKLNWDKVKQLRSSSIGLVKVAKSSLKKISKAISKNAKVDNPVYIEQLDTVCQAMEDVSPSVDDLMCCLYSSPTEISIQNEGTVLGEILEKLLQLCRQSHFCVEEDETWLDFLVKAVGHNRSKLESLKDV